ncbi:MAG: hypothetical protein WAR22_02145, partial [Desulfomonilia bacterium]
GGVVKSFPVRTGAEVVIEHGFTLVQRSCAPPFVTTLPKPVKPDCGRTAARLVPLTFPLLFWHIGQQVHDNAYPNFVHGSIFFRYAARTFHFAFTPGHPGEAYSLEGPGEASYPGKEHPMPRIALPVLMD